MSPANALQPWGRRTVQTKPQRGGPNDEDRTVMDVVILMNGPFEIEDGGGAVSVRAAPLGLCGFNRTGPQGYPTVVSLPSLHPGLA